MNHLPPSDQRPQSEVTAPATAVRKLPVSDLLRGDEEVVLLHQGQHYRLRLTKNGKLILTK